MISTNNADGTDYLRAALCLVWRGLNRIVGVFAVDHANMRVTLLSKGFFRIQQFQLQANASTTSVKAASSTNLMAGTNLLSLQAA